MEVWYGFYGPRKLLPSPLSGRAVHLPGVATVEHARRSPASAAVVTLR